jgi:beta-glucanase (GH16 family)
MANAALLGWDGRALAQSASAQKWFGNADIVPDTSGSSLNDAIYGTSAGYTLRGGAGDDTYYVYGGEKVVEAAGQGVDTIVAIVSTTLGEHVEHLRVEGPYARYAYGNAGDNIIKSDGAGHAINGGAGHDILVGGGGADVFIFGAGSGKDVITDFSASGAAKVRLDASYGLESFQEVTGRMTQSGSDVVLKLSADDSITFRNIKIGDFKADNFQLPIDLTGYKQTFADEFNSLSLWNGKTGAASAGVWRTSGTHGKDANDPLGRTLTNNGEKQVYTDPGFTGYGTKPLGLNPFSIDNGVLTIKAEPITGELRAALPGFEYTSGLLTTKMSFAQQYGYFEIRADLPSGAGAWPAFWLLPASGKWPPEIDVFEAYGDDIISMTSHTAGGGSHQTSGPVAAYVPGATSGFHTYGVNWTAESITWYIDGVEMGRTATPKDFHEPAYLLANLAVNGAAKPGELHADFKIDYIRVYSAPPELAKATSNTPVTATSGSVGGTVGSDTLEGTAGADSLSGQAGNDLIRGRAGSDTLSGDAGNDTVGGHEGDDLIGGGDGSDQLFGDAGNDTIGGHEGDDRLVGGDGNDKLFGDAGKDTIGGQNGDDSMIGGHGDDMIYGDAGRDTIAGEGGNDTVYGGTGSDLFNFAAGHGVDRVVDFSVADGDRISISGPRTLSHSGADTIITYGQGDSVTLVGVHLEAGSWLI